MSTSALTGIHQENAPARSGSTLGSHVEIGRYDDALSVFSPVRPRLFGIAYGMLGNAAEADDIAQDVWLRWQSTDRSVVQNPAAFLATTTTRLCINLKQSARSRHEICIEAPSSEPIDPSDDPALTAERGEELSRAVLELLEKLSPQERAAYILREAFDYSYRRIAAVVQMEEANARQLVSRARRHLTDNRRMTVSVSEHRRLVEAFIAATQNGEIAALEVLLSERCRTRTDSD